MHSALRTLLLESGLRESTSAVDRLDLGSPVGAIGGTSPITGDLLATYRTRAGHVASLQGEHWQRLSASTSEFANNLATHVGQHGSFVRIGNPNEPHFAVFVAESPEAAIGCMWVVPANTAFPSAV